MNRAQRRAMARVMPSRVDLAPDEYVRAVAHRMALGSLPVGDAFAQVHRDLSDSDSRAGSLALVAAAVYITGLLDRLASVLELPIDSVIAQTVAQEVPHD